MPKPVKPSLSLKMSLRFSSSIFASSSLDLTVDDDEHEENITYSSDTVVEENKEQHFTLTRAITWVMVQEQRHTNKGNNLDHGTRATLHTNKGNNLGHGTRATLHTNMCNNLGHGTRATLHTNMSNNLGHGTRATPH